MQKLTPCLWFDTEGEEAARFYTSIFPDSKAARGKKKPSAEAGDGKPEKQEEMSTEAIAMAYLMRGVHF